MKRRIFPVILTALIMSVTLCACGKVNKADASNKADVSNIADDTNSQITPTFTLPDDITIELFNQDIYSKDMWEWAKYVDALIEKNDGIEAYFENDYAIRNFDDYYSQNDGFYQIITNADSSRHVTGKTIADIKYGICDYISEIHVYDSKGSQSFLKISGLQVGQNAKDYLDSIKDGLWDEFCSLESNQTLYETNGWRLVHSQVTLGEVAYDQLVLRYEDCSFAYRLNGETVEEFLFVNSKYLKGGSKSISAIPVPKYSVDGKSITYTRAEEWYEKYQFKRNEFFHETVGKKGVSHGIIPCFSGDYAVAASLDYSSDEFYFYDGRGISKFEQKYPMSESFSIDRGFATITFEEEHGNISYPRCFEDFEAAYLCYEYDDSGSQCEYQFTFNEEALLFVEGSVFLPGDNIRETLDAYEEGAFDSLLSGNVIKSGSWSLSLFDNVLYLTHGNPAYADKITKYELELNGEVIAKVTVSGILKNITSITSPQGEKVEMEQTGEGIQLGNFYIGDVDITRMTPAEIMAFFDIPYEEGYLSAKPMGEYVAISRFHGYSNNDANRPNFSLSIYDPSVSTDGKVLIGVSDLSMDYGSISCFQSVDDDSASISIALRQGITNCSSISSNIPMPGESIKTSLDSYENGLYDALLTSGNVSLGDWNILLYESNNGKSVFMSNEVRPGDMCSISFKGDIVDNISIIRSK